ncbi:MAG: hypothetical protein KDA24_09335 [Deltaproteobacteria bacterium]|nr:hypothetical protein [Deltaproteobacteria bacterium]
MTDTARSCPNCGAAVTFAPDVISDRCVFCESALIAGSASTEHADRVAPFLVDRNAAAERLTAHLAGQWLAPKHVRETRSPEKLKGVLVPFWVHDAVARSRWDAMVGVHWYRTETYWVTVTRDGKTTRERRTRVVQETEWFPTEGTHGATYRNHLVSGSQGIPEGEANALEPFDLGGALPYAPELLAGWVAESPTIPRAQAASVARTELQGAEVNAVRAFLPGDVSRSVDVQSTIDVDPGRLVLLPVWVATYQWEDEVHRLLVNGQTGELVGAVPKAWAKIALVVVAGLFAAALLVAFILAFAAAVQ